MRSDTLRGRGGQVDVLQHGTDVTHPVPPRTVPVHSGAPSTESARLYMSTRGNCDPLKQSNRIQLNQKYM